jgi:hypothetical protein
MINVAPLEYRSALDSIMPALTKPNALVINNLIALDGELDERGATCQVRTLTSTIVWIEPLAATWTDDLSLIRSRLARNGKLYVVASLPLARYVPERSAWRELPLGIQARGMRQLQRGLNDSGFEINRVHGFHSAESIVLNGVGTICHTFGRSDIADRCNFAARLRYHRTGMSAKLSTVGLIESRRANIERERGASGVG